MQFGGDEVSARLDQPPALPDIIPAASQQCLPGDDEMTAVAPPVGTFHGGHSPASARGWMISSIRRRRYSPARFGQSIEAPRGIPMSAAPMGVSTEIR